ncbi:hemogen isoform X2 [Excalfactoria chinensis]|uniref:hemogen isoform X2 n=1 Tax=Excalfactoria chinensis TaxID=46218 RepID=UPI003B3A216C
MDSLEKDSDCADTSPSSTACKEKPESGSTMFYHLRDREMLRKRKAEAKEKDSIQWALGDHEISKRQKRRQGARRRKNSECVMEPAPPPATQPNAQSMQQEEDETMSSMMTQQAESLQLDMQDLFSGEEDMLKLADEIQDILDTSLENNGSDNDTFSSSPF